MRFEKLSLTNADGLQLSARPDMPVGGEPVAFALFAHCFTCTKNLKAISYISRALSATGVAVLRFDFTGLGEIERGCCKLPIAARFTGHSRRRFLSRAGSFQTMVPLGMDRAGKLSERV